MLLLYNCLLPLAAVVVTELGVEILGFRDRLKSEREFACRVGVGPFAALVVPGELGGWAHDEW